MVLVVLAFVVGVVAFPSRAATINVAAGEVAVSPGNGKCSLREAILNTESGGDISGGDCASGTAGLDIVSLTAFSTYVLSDQDPNHLDGEVNGLPEIHYQITIEGNNATIQRDPALFTGTPCGGAGARFRIFYVSKLGNLTLNNLTIQNGCANVGGFGAGGAIFNRGTLSLDNVTVSNNEALRSGGAIHNDGTLTVTRSTVSNNAVTAIEAGGGGIVNRGTMQVVQSTISGNNGAGAGGGVDTGLGTAAFTNSTVSGNRSEGDGGGIFNRSPSTTIVNSTVLLNRGTNSVAAGPGSGIYLGSGTVTLTNSLVARQVNGANCFGVSGGGNNLADDGTCPTAIVSATPLVGPLANNGGPTQTHALLSGSPAIDAGSDASLVSLVDQRGVSRPQGAASDIGAFEATAPTVNTPVVSPTGTGEGTITGFSVSGTFTDPAGVLAQPFTAVVNWGDSTTSVATVSGSGNSFSYNFSGSHTYAQNGSYGVTVSVTNSGGGTGTSAPTSVTVVVPADLSITKTASGAFFVSSPSTYGITITNNGPNNAGAVVVTDTIPANTTFVSATPTQGSCTGTTTVTCALGAIANGGSAMISLKVTPSAEGPLSNTASVSAAPQPDPNPANNSSTVTVTVLPAAAIPMLSEMMLALLAVILAAIALRK